MLDEFAAILLRKIAEDGLEHSQMVNAGAPEDWGAYQREVGYMAGLTKTMELVPEVLRQFLNDDEAEANESR